VQEFGEELEQLKKKNLLRKPACVESSHGSKISINRQIYIDFSSNDYLGLSGHPQIVHAAIQALKNFGLGSGASRLLSGTFSSHKNLEERISKFKRTEAALVFNTGYAANTGVLPAIADSETVIFSDELNHASIIDGIRLSRAKIKIYRHNDLDHLEMLMKKSLSLKNIRRRLTITDTVFSMDGDIAPLHEILSLCEIYDSLLMIDDAHGTGVLGKAGRGGLEHFDIKKTGHVIQMGTLSKALGCFGAFVAGPKDLIHLLANKARSFMYSTSLPPAIAEACIQAIDLVEFDSADRRRTLWNNRQMLFDGLNSIGYDTLSSNTPIIPVLIGKIKDSLKAGQTLYKEKIFAPAIRPPTVPEGKCRIRLSVTAAHTRHDIDSFLDVMRKLK